MMRMLKTLSLVPRWTKIGVIGVMLCYAGVAGVVSVTVPWWFGAGDTPPHIDYVWNVYNYSLPNFDDGLTYEPLRQKASELEGQQYHVQFTSQHPPLFYVLHAPFLGPLLEAGEWQKAIALGRALNVFFGVLAVAALAWAGWIFGGRYKNLLAVGVPAIGVLMNPFTTLNISFNNDVLVALFSTLAFVFMYKTLKDGLTRNNILMLSAVNILGLSIRANFIVVLGVSVLAIFIAGLFHTKKINMLAVIKAGSVSLLPVGLAVIAIGWFYYFQNFLATGDFTRSGAQDWISNSRPYKSLRTVLTSNDLWSLWSSRFMTNRIYSNYLSIIAAVGASIALLKKKQWKRLIFDRYNVTIIALMATAAFLALGTQIVHAVGYGGFYFRYLFPALLPISLLLAHGLLGFGSKIGRLLIAGTCVGMALTTTNAISKSSLVRNTFSEQMTGISNPIEAIVVASSANGIPLTVTVGLFTIMGIGILFLIVSLLKVGVEPIKVSVNRNEENQAA